MRCYSPFFCLLVATVLLTLAGCVARSPVQLPAEPIPPIAPDTWREIREEIWTASTLAHLEARNYVSAAMREWMVRVRDKTETEFVPWYTGYWTQQWIGFKAGWYEMNKDEDEPPVEEHLIEYIQEKYYELVLEPAGIPSDPHTITERAAALFVRLLSEQLQCIPKIHSVSLRSLQQKLERVPLITLSGTRSGTVSLLQVFEQDHLDEVPAYDALLAHADSVAGQESSSPQKESLQVVAEDTVARLVAQLPVRAGGSATGLVIGEALGMFIAAGVAAWSAISHDQERPEIESQLRQALDAGLEDMWQRLMEDPELGVLYPVNHMSQQIEMAIFPENKPVPVMPF